MMSSTRRPGGTANEQAIDADTRHALEANGLRVGVASGDLPPEVIALLEAPPPHKVDPKTVLLPDGDTLLIPLGSPVPRASLLLSRDGHAVGKEYQDAGGAFRVTANQEGRVGVSLRIVPEVHHGSYQRRVGSDPAGGAFAPSNSCSRTGRRRSRSATSPPR